MFFNLYYIKKALFNLNQQEFQRRTENYLITINR
jgi:hypothetical protein